MIEHASYNEESPILYITRGVDYYRYKFNKRTWNADTNIIISIHSMSATSLCYYTRIMRNGLSYTGTTINSCQL